MSGDNLPARATADRPHYAIDHDAVLKAVGINARDPNAQALLLTCERYGLDPILKHMILIQGRPYVTRDGLLHVAHRSGQFDGIEVVEQGETQTHHTAKVSVYRKDMGRPFTYIGRYPKNGSNKGYGPEMAVKCGEVMALRRAFNVGLCAREEVWDQEVVDETPANGRVSRRREALPEPIDVEHEADEQEPAPDHREVNRAFPPRETREVYEAPEDDGPAPTPQATPWAVYVRDRVDRAKKHWQTEMALSRVAPDVQSHPDFAMPNIHEVENHFVSHAIKSGALKAEDIAKDDKPGIRDPKKAKAAMADLFAKAPKRIRAAVDAYFAEKERALRVKLGMDDVDVMAQAEPAEVGAGREPGEDG